MFKMKTEDFSFDEDVNCPGQYSVKCPSGGWIQPGVSMVPVGFSIVSSTLSVIGALLTITPFVLWKDVRTGIRRIVTFLAVADLLTALSYLMGTINYIVYQHKSKNEVTESCMRFSTVCQIQSFLSCWFSMSSFLWTAILALYLYRKISNGDVGKIDQCFPLTHVISWGVPIVLVFPLLCIDYLGFSVFAAGGWCFVKGDHPITSHSVNARFHLGLKTVITILIGGKALEVSTYIWVMILFCKIYYVIHKVSFID